MPDLKPTAFPALTSLDAADLVTVVDVSDTTDDPAGSDKKMTGANLATSIATLGSLATDAEVTSAISAHAGATDPHGDRVYAAGLISTHEAAGDPHPGYVLNAELASHTGATSGAHGISAFGATLVDDADAAAARTTLELGSLATLSAITTTQITDGTIVDADINASAAIALSKLATDPRARSSHTGTQTASTISDFAEAVDDEVATFLVAGANITLTHNDPGNSLTIAASGGGGVSLVSPAASGTDYWTIPGVSLSGTATMTLVANTVYYQHIVIPVACTITRVAVEVTTGSAGNLSIWLYNCTSAGQPGALVADFGEITTMVSTGLKSLTGLSVSAPAGNYLVAIVGDSTPVLRTARGTTANPWLRDIFAGSAILNQSRGALTYTSTPPDPGTAWNTVSTVTTPVDYPVLFGVS